MKLQVQLLSLSILMVALTLFLAGCQIIEMLWPNTNLAEIGDALPDEAAIEALEEAIEELESELEEVEPEPDLGVTVSPILNSFTFNYKYDSEAVAFKGTTEETRKVVYQSGQVKGEPFNWTFPFSEKFLGSQYTTVEGLNGGVACYVLLKSDVTYQVEGEFFPETCEFIFTLTYDFIDMNVVENNCLEYANLLANYYTFFSPPPEKTIVIQQENEIVFLDPYHSVWLTDIHFGYNVPCTMK